MRKPRPNHSDKDGRQYSQDETRRYIQRLQDENYKLRRQVEIDAQSKHEVIMWERLMMQLLNVDGPACVTVAIEKLKAEARQAYAIKACLLWGASAVASIVFISYVFWG